MTKRKQIQQQFEEALLDVLQAPDDGSPRKLNSRVLDVVRQYLKDAKDPEDENKSEEAVLRGELRGVLAEYDERMKGSLPQ